MTVKRAGADCPKCRDPCPAEYAQAGQPPRWSCSCGAGGEIQGGYFAGRPPAPSPTPAPTVKKHWRTP